MVLLETSTPSVVMGFPPNDAVHVLHGVEPILHAKHELTTL